jgi:hypothetical protein
LIGVLKGRKNGGCQAMLPVRFSVEYIPNFNRAVRYFGPIWTLPDGDADFSTRWGLIKRGFSARIAKGESRSASRISNGERGIWQRRFWEHTVRDDVDFVRHVDYVHFNPWSNMAWSAMPGGIASLLIAPAILIIPR